MKLDNPRLVFHGQNFISRPSQFTIEINNGKNKSILCRGYECDLHLESEINFIDAAKFVLAAVTMHDLLSSLAEMVADSQAWDGNDPDDNRWSILYSRARKCLNAIEEIKSGNYQPEGQ